MDQFVWDEAKNADNIRERGFGFEIVYLLDWSTVIIEEDKRFDYGEARYFVVGRIDDRPYYVVQAVLRRHCASRRHQPGTERKTDAREGGTTLWNLIGNALHRHRTTIRCPN